MVAAGHDRDDDQQNEHGNEQPHEVPPARGTLRHSGVLLRRVPVHVGTRVVSRRDVDGEGGRRATERCAAPMPRCASGRKAMWSFELPKKRCSKTAGCRGAPPRTRLATSRHGHQSCSPCGRRQAGAVACVRCKMPPPTASARRVARREPPLLLSRPGGSAPHAANDARAARCSAAAIARQRRNDLPRLRPSTTATTTTLRNRTSDNTSKHSAVR